MAGLTTRRVSSSSLRGVADGVRPGLVQECAHGLRYDAPVHGLANTNQSVPVIMRGANGAPSRR